MALGLLMAAAIYAIASVRYWKSTRRLAALEKQCETPETPRHWITVDPRELVPIDPREFVPDKPLSDKDVTPEPLAGSKPICDPEELLTVPNADDIEMVREFKSRNQAWDTTTWWAIIVGLVLLIPRVWYFLLGRIAELSAAIKGS